MKIKLRYLALGLVALFGSLLASSQHISAYAATDRLSSSSAAGASVLGTSSVPPAGASTAPRTLATSFVYLPLIMKPPMEISGYLTQGGAPIGGISLVLGFYNGSSSSAAATTTTNSAGYYVFNGLPALAMGQYYYVEYANLEHNNSRLSLWWSRDVTSSTTTSSVSLGTSDLANILLSAPSPGATVALPYLFQWIRRSATPSDSYFLELFAPYGSAYASTQYLGYISGVPVAGLPIGFSPYVQYGWDVGLRDSNLGIGFSYYYRTVTFSNAGTSSSGPLNIAPQSTGRRDRLPPHPHPEE